MKRFHFQLIPSIFFVVSLGILLALGTWQLKRLAWKNAMVETFGARLLLPPQLLPPTSSWQTANLEELNFRPVEAQGEFNSDQEIHLYTQISRKSAKRRGAGYWVITPFELDKGGVILVNTGFVPEQYKDVKTRPWQKVTGKHHIAGIIKTDQGKNYFTPEDDVANNVWFTRNVATINRHLQLKNAAPFMIALTRGLNEGGLPQPRVAKISLANNHMGYAITWYGLALMLAGVFFAFSWKRRE